MPDGRDRDPMEREAPIRFDEVAHEDYFELRCTATYAPDVPVKFASRQAQTQPRIKVAVLGALPMVHWQRFGEIVATNRGAFIRVFLDEAEALEWLVHDQKAA